MIVALSDIHIITKKIIQLESYLNIEIVQLHLKNQIKFYFTEVYGKL